MRIAVISLSIAMVFSASAACGDDDSTANDNNNNNQNSVTGECGDGVLNAGEECDDGVQNSDSAADACRTDCRSAWCGDNVVDGGETCDDGNASNEDGCLTECSGSDDCCATNLCGDGYVDSTPVGADDQVEACDDGNTSDDNVCSGDCQQDMTECGNGQLDQGEDCDYGGGNSNTIPDACRLDCRTASCGDGVADSVEGCDASDLRGEDCTTIGQGFNGGSLSCATSCTLDVSQCTACGDGNIDPGEECEGANLNGESCVSQGFDYGDLTCTASCQVDGSSCSNFAIATEDSFISEDLHDIYATGPGNLWAVGANDAIVRNAGTIWINNSFGVTEDWFGVWASGGYGVTVGQNGRVYEVHSGGPNIYQVPPNSTLNAISGFGASVIVAVGGAGLAVRCLSWPNCTAAWSNISPMGVTANLLDIFYASTGEAYVVGAGGTALRYQTTTWTPLTSGTTADLHGVWSNPAGTDVYVVGDGGTILHYDVGANLWSPMVAPAGTPRLRGVHGTTDSNIWAVGDNGTILHYNGAVWHTVATTPAQTLYAVYSDIAGTISTAWAVGTNGTIIKLQEG